MKIICDSSSIITLADNCLFYIVEALSRKGTDFLIPVAVKKEIFNTPISTRKFKFEAVRVGEAIRKGWLKVYDSEKPKREVRKIANKIMDASNELFFVGRKPLRLIQYGEAEALALARVIGVNTILVDEKNTRMIIENPEAMAEFIGRRIGKNVSVNRNALKALKHELRGLEVIRSVEVVMVALEQGLLDHYVQKNDGTSKKDLVLGLLYALKKSGCAISEDEIREYYRMKVK